MYQFFRAKRTARMFTRGKPNLTGVLIGHKGRKVRRGYKIGTSGAGGRYVATAAAVGAARALGSPALWSMVAYAGLWVLTLPLRVACHFLTDPRTPEEKQMTMAEYLNRDMAKSEADRAAMKRSVIGNARNDPFHTKP